MRTRPGARVSLRPIVGRCARCGRDFTGYERRELCLSCVAAQGGAAHAPPGPVAGAGSGPSTAMHRAKFEGGFKVVLIISATGIRYHWSPPLLTCSAALRAMLRTPFASWVNRFVRAYASEHGLSVRPVPAEPDLLEPDAEPRA